MRTLNPINKPDSLRKQVYLALREGLRNGQFANNRLVEREIADQLGVSRTPVREALVLLESDGILVATGRGFRANILSDDEIQEIYEIRQLLEPYAISMVTKDLDDSTLAQLQQHYQDQLDAHANNDGAAFSEANQQFRYCWIQHVPNARLVKAIELHDDHVVFLRKLTLERAKYRQASIEGSERLMEHLTKRDADAVRTIMSEHLVVAENSLRDELQQINS